ncbi:MAG: HTH domain-containing protein [Candidatus Taylorbacteria bacterium]|nr:HTH domain-containing protein [Candidatus Taylorbacteria bacterium]
MDSMDIKQSLAQYGLTNNEIEVYIFLLSNRDIPAYEIARQTRIPRTTVYNTLEALEAQGIISSWKKNGVKHFSAESPERLSRILKQKQEILSSILPDMLNIYEHESIHPSTKIYIGKEGVKHVFENILDIVKRKNIGELFVFSDYHLTEQLPKYFNDWRKRKNKTGAFTYLIVPPGTPKNEDYTSNQFRESRMMPDSFPFEGSVDICGSHVAFFSFREGEMYAVTVDSDIVASMLTLFFKYIWSTLENSKFNP